jgi:hypothetical protein
MFAAWFAVIISYCQQTLSARRIWREAVVSFPKRTISFLLESFRHPGTLVPCLFVHSGWNVLIKKFMCPTSWLLYLITCFNAHVTEYLPGSSILQSIGQWFPTCSLQNLQGVRRTYFLCSQFHKAISNFVSSVTARFRKIYFSSLFILSVFTLYFVRRKWITVWRTSIWPQ